MIVALTDKRNLILNVTGQADNTHTWVLDPLPGIDSFCIVVHSNQAQKARSDKPSSWSSYFGAIVKLVLPFLFRRTQRSSLLGTQSGD